MRCSPLWHSGGFVVSECDGIRLADAVVAQLPDVPAGRSGEVVLAPTGAYSDTDYAYGVSEVEAASEDSVGLRHDLPACPTGSCGIHPGHPGPFDIRAAWRHSAHAGVA